MNKEVNVDNVSSDKIASIVKMTTYSIQEAEEMLLKYDDNVENVIRHYMDIPIVNTDKSKDKVRSINQEKYRQIRYTLDHSMKEYRNLLEKQNITTN
jgi:hypothetical protein